MTAEDLIPHLFRSEYSRLTSILCLHYGLKNIQFAEDMVSEAFSTALESWPRHGIPYNPKGWLYQVAKNKALNAYKRLQKLEEINDCQSHEDWQGEYNEELIQDSQLRMIFTLCNPQIAEESRIALALRILCGFGIEEIANAFVTSPSTINKRLFRAKKSLREHSPELLSLKELDINNRLDNVLQTIYLLFNEGYYSESSDAIIRKDLCLEALRLGYLLTANPVTNTRETQALIALMCFHSSRLDSRLSFLGEIILYNEQDSNKWDQRLIAKGAEFLKKASFGDQYSSYHLEASIAYWHTINEDSVEKWTRILQLYDLLLQKKYSTIVAMNRIYAVFKVKGADHAIREVQDTSLPVNQYYYCLLAELYSEKDQSKAIDFLLEASTLVKTKPEVNLITKKLQSYQK